jgi:tetratricopeptide (TPR) repeat protein
MSIDPSIPSTPFAKIGKCSNYYADDEILFSMCSVFRITEIKQVDNRYCLWQVNLTEVSDYDTQLHALTERIRKETLPNAQGWHRLGRLFIQHGQLNKAEEMYLELLDQATEENQKAFIYYHLGSIKSDQGEYREAVKFYEKSIEIDKELFFSNNPRFIAPYSGIGQAYSKMGECSKALTYYEKAHKIAEEALPKTDPGLATSYNNIGSVYSKMGEYSKALSAYEHAIDAAQRSNHPNLRTFQQNLEVVRKKM